MRVLALETSCDETAAAVVGWTDGIFKIHSSVVHSQAAKHAVYGGVVPELATREHLGSLEWVATQALKEADATWDSLHAVCATRGPGLASSLLMGHSFAKAAALTAGLPFLGVNHLEGHLVSPFLAGGALFPPKEGSWLSLIVSGGHTLLLRTDSHLEHVVLGRTRDDAAGEAFDKGAKLLGLGYPGGPALEKMARGGRTDRFVFPRGMATSGDLHFSFSGVKTALRIRVEKEFPDADGRAGAMPDLCASYQEAIVESLAEKSRTGIQQSGVKLLAVSGGVACNQRLRQVLVEVCHEEGVRLLIAEPGVCTDNAAMIGAVGCVRHTQGFESVWTEDIDPNLPLAR